MRPYRANNRLSSVRSNVTRLAEAGDRESAAPWFAESGLSARAAGLYDRAASDLARAVEIADFDPPSEQMLVEWLSALAQVVRLARAVPRLPELVRRLHLRLTRPARTQSPQRLAMLVDLASLMAVLHRYKEARRVLKPGGHFFFNVWDKISENEFADVVTEALAVVFPRDPPRFMARTPHGYHDVEQIRRELNAAGFTNISVDAVDAKSKAASPREPAIAYCQGTPLRNEIEARDVSRLEEATQKAAEALARRFGNGPIEGRIRAHVITANP